MKINPFGEEKLADVLQELSDSPPPTVVKEEIPINYALLRQLIDSRFLSVVVRRTVAASGIVERPVFSMVNQAGRGMEKQSLEISFCPFTGADLSRVDFAQLNTREPVPISF